MKVHIGAAPQLHHERRVQVLRRQLVQMEPAAAANLTSSQALDVVRGIHPTSLKPEAAAALLRPATQLSPYEQRGLAQSLLRVLLAHCRRDGSLAPLHYEEIAR